MKYQFQRALWITVVTLIVAIAFGADRVPSRFISDPLKNESTSDVPTTHSKTRIPLLFERAVDGDTLIGKMRGERVRLRLIAIDAPEIALSPRSKAQAAFHRTTVDAILQKGELAKIRLEKLCNEGEFLYVEMDRAPRDKYKRYLVYLFNERNELLNEILLREGVADFFPPDPNIKYRERLWAAAKHLKGKSH